MTGQEKHGYAVIVQKDSRHNLAEEKKDLAYRTHQFSCTNKNILKPIMKILLVAYRMQQYLKNLCIGKLSSLHELSQGGNMARKAENEIMNK